MWFSSIYDIFKQSQKCIHTPSIITVTFIVIIEYNNFVKYQNKISGRLVNLCRFMKIKIFIFLNTFLVNHKISMIFWNFSHRLDSFSVPLCKTPLDSMRKSCRGDFWNYSSWRNSSHESSFPATETDNNKVNEIFQLKFFNFSSVMT